MIRSYSGLLQCNKNEWTIATHINIVESYSCFYLYKAHEQAKLPYRIRSQESGVIVIGKRPKGNSGVLEHSIS